MDKLYDGGLDFKGYGVHDSKCHVQAFHDPENNKYVFIISDADFNTGTSVINDYANIANEVLKKLGLFDALYLVADKALWIESKLDEEYWDEVNLWHNNCEFKGHEWTQKGFTREELEQLVGQKIF